MNQQLWSRIEPLLDEALEKPPAEREQYAREACGNDTVLRKELMALIDADREETSVLSSPLEWSVASLVNAVEDGQVAYAVSGVGPFRFREFIGEADGVKWYEGDLTTSRDEESFLVRVFEEPPASPDVIQFISRRLASVSHTHLAKFVEWGQDGPGHFMVTELVRGPSLLEYADEHGWSPAIRVERFREVCQTVAHLHAHGILVDGISADTVRMDGATPKILDAGLSSLVRPAFHGAGARTISPESHWGEPTTTQSDVFCLGALLFRLLVGSGPSFPASPPNHWTSARKASESIGDDLVSLERTRSMDARELKAFLSMHVDDILVRALDPDPHLRHPTVQHLDEALESITH